MPGFGVQDWFIDNELLRIQVAKLWSVYNSKATLIAKSLLS